MKTNEEEDYSGYLEVGHNSAHAAMDDIINLAQAQLKAEQLVEKLEEDLASAKENLCDISENQLPEKMEQLGLPSFTTNDGITIKIKEEIRANISEERKPPAHDWLEKNGYGALIKSEVVTPFGRDEIQQANELVTTLQKQGRLANLKRGVNFQTLQAFVREQLAKGKDIPIDLFGVNRKHISKVSIK